MSVTTLRRLPVPASEPPYDDERTGHGGAGTPAVQGTLALAFLLPSGLPSTPVAPPGLRLVMSRPEAEETADLVDFGPQPTATSDLPEARGWAGRFAQAMVEVLAGDRPLAQLVRFTTTGVYDEVAGLIARPDVTRADTARGVVRSVHVSEPADGIAEICALVRRGARSTALALRVEGLDGRWQCTALELG
ncbi:MAG: Rv3235 family protein [Sporichthyaceae bacterium]